MTFTPTLGVGLISPEIVMAKLYAMEETDETDPLDKRNQLLIDKVLEYEQKTKSDVSITADLIKQRHDLRKEITTQFNENKEESGDDTDGDSSQEDSGASDESTDAESGDSTQDEKDNDTDKKDTETSDDADADKDAGDRDESKKSDNKNKDSDESDESAAADDVDSLRSMVGSGGSGKKEPEKKEAQESFKAAPARLKSKEGGNPLASTIGFQTALKNIFAPLKQTHHKRMVAIESFQLQDKPKVTDQPVAYVKEEVLESLNRLISLANQYIQKNQSTITQGGEGLKHIGEKLTAYKQFVEEGKFQFSQKLLSSSEETDFIVPLSVKGKNELEYTSALLAKYLESSSSLAVKILQNPFTQLADAFSAAGYKSEDSQIFIAQTLLPGFIQMQSSIAPFKNYIEADYEEYQIYKVQTYKPQDLYTLPSISLDQDKDLRKLLQELDKILMSAAMILDNLKIVSDRYHSFVDSLKTLIYDIENNKQTNLAELGLDEKMMDFIKFKLVTELYVNDFDAAVRYITAAISALSHLIELNEG